MGSEQDGDKNRSERLRGHDWFKIRNQVLDRDDYTCRNCESTTNLVVHHIVPIEASGTNRRSNLATLCRSCHRSAHNERVRDSGRVQATDSARYLLTVDELKQVLQKATHLLDRAMITTLAKTGVGVGELCNLDLDDVQLPGLNLKQISGDIPENIRLLRVRYGGNLPYNNRKERKATTYIPIDDELAYVLRQWLAIRPDTRESEPLFASTQRQWGSRISPQIIRNSVETYGKKLGFYDENSQIQNLTPYSFRYFFEERFSGQPRVRNYLLGRRTDLNWSLDEIATHYEQHIFELNLN